ncbi:MAG: MFS transporter [Thaumarchaeota archaeon]|nr:MFS transporter [Nitrososphaerota archaeon]
MKNEEGRKLGFRNVVNLGIVSLFTDVSTEMILGVLPLFVINDLHATKALLGLMEGASDSLNYAFRVVSGFVSDRFARRKPLVLIGYFLSSVSKPFFALASSWSDAVIVRLTDRAGKGVRTSPRDALISDSIDELHSGKAFGLHRSLDQVGAVIGPILAFLLIPLLGVRGLFLFSFVPGVIGVFVLVLLVRDSRGTRSSTSFLRNATAVLNRKFTFYLIVVGIFAIGAYNFSFVLVKAGALGVGEGTSPLVYAALNLATVLIGLPVGVLADKFGRARLLIVPFGLFLLSTAMSFFLTVGILFAFAIAFTYGLYLGASDTLQRAIIPSLTPSELKGTAYGVYYILVAICTLVANVVFGFLWDSVSSGAAFGYSLATAVLATVALAAFLHLK